MKKDEMNHKEEFQELTQDLSEAMYEVKDSVAIGTMLYQIAEEKKSNNLVIREINGKFDNIMEKLDQLNYQLADLNKNLNKRSVKEVEKETTSLSGRDKEVFEFVKGKEKVCADDIKEEFNYKGRNAASARLSRLFKEDLLEKEYAGRKVYYKLRS